MSIDIDQERTTYPAVVGRILAMLREKHGMEQSDVADRVGLSQSTWSRIERGESAFTMEQLATVSSVFGTSPGHILRRADEAVAGLERMNIIVEPGRPIRTGNTALTLIGAAVLGFLIAKALSK